jgi:glutamyl-Q tRNA(Asp) synthetase
MRVPDPDAPFPHPIPPQLATRLPKGRWRTRFAPAPTGYLHLGHVVNALHVWGVARAHGGEVLLRIEDHDRTRSRPEYEQALLEDLDWLGFHHDVGLIATPAREPSPYRQSDNDARYAEALARLDAQGLVYPCTCSRRDIAHLVGQRPNEEMRYPGTCRDRHIDPGVTLARRVRLEDEAQTFDDLRHGPVVQRPARETGDLLARDRAGDWSYQFAVVVDDIAHDIDVVIRGDDLLGSTGRQLQLAGLLGRTRSIRFLHHALLRHPDGTKLSKSNRDTGVRELRAAGMRPADVIGLAAHQGGLVTSVRAMGLEDVAGLFAAS